MTTPARRTALVTGASTGLGFAIATALVDDGWNVAATDLDAVRLAPLVDYGKAAGCHVTPLPLDLRKQDDIGLMLGRTWAAYGGLDLLVNNAGRALITPATDVTWDEWDDVLDTNLKGAFFMSAGYARRCIDARKSGAIVNVASTHGLTGIAGRSVYGISKGGLVQMTRMHAIEWAEHGIRVNAVAPTTVMTPSRSAMLAEPDKRAQMLSRIPLARFPEPAEIGAAVLYLASPAAASITGHTLLLDGGLTAA